MKSRLACRIAAAARLLRLAPAATLLLSLAASTLLLGLAAPTALASDWTNSGGNAGRYGLSTSIGPTSANLLWSGGRSSLIAWLPVTEGNRVFMVRQPKWPDQQPDDAFIVASDVLTGGERWAVVLPYHTGDWIPWIAGVKNGKVFASRSGNGASVRAKMYALDATNGGILWESVDAQDAGAYDGVVFAPNGDPIVASFRDIWRFNAADGTTVWHAARTGSVSGSCGGALSGNAFYVADAASGGNILVRYDATTGARLYQSPVMSGFTLQNTPMVGPDGTVYLDRAQNNPSVDYYYAFQDDGTQFIQKWRVAGNGGAFAEFGIGPDGSVYFVLPGPKLSRLDPATGAVLNQTAVLSGFSEARLAIDADGKVFFSNGAFNTGRLYSYDADLTPRWDVAVPNINIGGPSLSDNGTLIVCGTGTDVRAYYTTNPADVADLPSTGSPAMWSVSGPNPFRDATTIRFRLSRPEAVTLEVFDVNGTRVARLLRDAPRDQGEWSAMWQGRDESGAPAASGVYYYRLTAEEGTATGRILLAR